jgi:hypothetical protein
MPQWPAQVTQAEVARIIRAVKQAGVSGVLVKVCYSLPGAPGQRSPWKNLAISE